MKVPAHVCTSTLLGAALYAHTGSWQVAAAGLVSGVLIDVDHIFDFLIFSGEAFSVRNLFSWCDDGRWERISLPFHSYELYLLAGLITYFRPSPIMAGVLCGTGLHLLLDQFGNRYLAPRFSVSLWFYFFAFRFSVGFRKERLRTDHPVALSRVPGGMG